MDNRRLARVFAEIGDLLDIKGENPFRIRSYRMAAETLENLGEDVAARVRRGDLVEPSPDEAASRYEHLDAADMKQAAVVMARSYGSLLNFLKFGFRFSRKAFLPSLPSSVR